MPARPASPRPARSYQAAAAILAERDPVLRALVAAAGPARVPPPTETHFEALVRAIVYQQLAGAAAAAIHGRLDVWPTGDLGVRKGFGLAWRIPAPTARELEPLGDPYRPYRSVLAWYCWRAAELYGGPGAGQSVNVTES